MNKLNIICSVTYRRPRAIFLAECMANIRRKEWDYNFNNPQSYRYFWCELDQDLSESVGLTFEIEIVESGSEELLDSQAREVWHTNKGIAKLGKNSLARPNTRNAHGYGGYGVNNDFQSSQVSRGKALGHEYCTQIEITEWY